MKGIVLDAGALIALERNDRTLWAVLKSAARAGDDVLVPSTVLAQVWRNRPTQNNVARALQHCVIAGFDPVATLVGELCGRAGTRDICDAHVALVAATRGYALYTSDPQDLRRLIKALGKESPTIIRC
jgi:predicted nucleic acid-binding protein